MKQCIAAPTFSILVNRSPTWFILSTQGLRQGDPLSPYLFSLVMEVFSTMLDLEVIRGYIALLPDNRGISHLIFANNVLVFSSGSLSSIKRVDMVFKRFAKMSGLFINKEKSTVFISDNCTQKNTNSNNSGHKNGDFPDQILGNSSC